MNDTPTPQPGPQRAVVQTKAGRPFQVIWLIPLVAAAIAAYLVYQTLSNSGPEISISFPTASGIVAGQTKVSYKAVDLGTVRDVRLSPDMAGVEVRVGMSQAAARTLTAGARFWVVRPRLTASNISGLDTVLSGSYIELDPGTGRGERKTSFVGLSDPPTVRTGESGIPVTLTADRIGSIQPGAPVLYRDIPAGEVSSFKLGKEGEGVTIHAFVRAPYDQFVRQGTHFWNASGIAVDLGAQGVQVRVASLQAVLSGGIAFDTAAAARTTPLAKPDTTYPLFRSEAEAQTAGYSQQIKFVTYFDGSVRGLSVNAPVELYGIQVGTVTGISLELAPSGKSSRVVVHMDVQPERIMNSAEAKPGNTLAVTQAMVRRGLRAQLQSANLLTGQSLIAFNFLPDAAPAEARQQGDEVEVPNVAGGLDSITTSLANVARKLSALPLDQIAGNLNDTLRGVSQTLATAQAVVRKIDTDSAPLLERLPAIAQGLQAAVDHAGRLASSADNGYGANSSFRRDLGRLLSEAGDTARSVRLLADYLDQHPEALIRGRSGR